MNAAEIRRQRLVLLDKYVSPEGAHAAVLTLETIEALHAIDGRPPSYREVADVRKLTVPGIQWQVRYLVNAGLLSSNKSSRSFKVLGVGTEGEWVDVLRKTFHREETKKNPQAAVLSQAEDALYALDLEGSEIEVVIRHKP
jgi:hypothetical protein